MMWRLLSSLVVADDSAGSPLAVAACGRVRPYAGAGEQPHLRLSAALSRPTLR